MIKEPSFSVWESSFEAEFIDRMGEHSKIRATRLQLLRGYRAALDRRAASCGLDIAALKQRCDAAIATELAALTIRRARIH